MQVKDLPQKIRLIVATRYNQEDFFRLSATGRTLRNTVYPSLELRLIPSNKDGLPTVYNQIIQESIGNSDVMVFAHDDIHFLDFYWCYRLNKALDEFDIVGLAGGELRVDYQPIWSVVEKLDWSIQSNPHPYKNKKWIPGTHHLSGAVGHGKSIDEIKVGYFGPSGKLVKLIDGLFIASRLSTLIDNKLFFDELFDFHFYDLDFCRQAEVKGLSCGTCDISVMHESAGAFYSPAWHDAYDTYIKKWGK